MVQVSACARFAQLARTFSTACCFSSKKPVRRDELKARRGSTRDSVEFGCGFSADDEDEDGPGSGDEDVLVSLGASYRAWRVYHREKRAHDYTKSRLVEAFRRETVLEKQLARVGGSTEGIECVLMKMEDLEATVTASAEKYDDEIQNLHEEDSQNAMAGHPNGGESVLEGNQVSEHEFEALQLRCAVYVNQLSDAEAAKLHWKKQYQQLLSKMVASLREQQQLQGELRNVKKTAVLMANRQYAHLGANDRAVEPLPRTDESDKRTNKKRSYSAVKVGQSML